MRKKILIVGAGTIGCLVGGKLVRSGQDVTLLGRARLMDTISERGLVIKSEDEVVQVADLITMTAPPDDQTYDLIIFTVKAYDTATAAQAVVPNCAPRTAALSLQNGVGNEETLRRVLGDAVEILAGTITISAQFSSDNVLEMRTTKGGIGIASVQGRYGDNVLSTPSPSGRNPHCVIETVELFRAAGFETRGYKDYRAMKWSKLLLNMIANAPCAILDMPPEQVMADEQLFALERDAFREALRVMRAAKIRPVALPGYPVPLLAWLIDILPLALLKPLRGRVVGGRGGKMPSLHIDLARRLAAPLVVDKLLSEVEYLNGAVVRLADELGVSAPVNRAIYVTLSNILHGVERWEIYRGKPQWLLDNVARNLTS